MSEAEFDRKMPTAVAKKLEPLEDKDKAHEKMRQRLLVERHRRRTLTTQLTDLRTVHSEAKVLSLLVNVRNLLLRVSDHIPSWFLIISLRGF